MLSDERIQELWIDWCESKRNHLAFARVVEAEATKELRELVRAIVENRARCFIPTEGGPEALLEWDERAAAALVEPKRK